jgi:YVTN family beta-propeller protein
VLQNNGSDSLSFSSNGSFTFSSSVAKGASYTVTVATQPTNPAQTCSVHNGSGAITNVTVVNVVVTCTQPALYAYVANESDNTVSAFAIDSSSGALVPLIDSPVVLNGTAPQALAVDPNGAYLYVANNTSDDVSILSIDYTTGLLTATAIAVPTGHAPTAVTIDPTNRFMYVTNYGDDTVSAYTLSAGTATAISGSPYAVGSQPFSVKTDPAGNYLYVTNFADGTVSAFGIDSATGALTPLDGSPFGAGGAGAGSVAIAVDPTGAFAYVANETAASISLFSVGATTGTLSPVSGSPLSTGSSPEALALSPGGGTLYVANVTGNNEITDFAITATTGGLTTGTPVAAGTFPLSLVADPGGGFVYAANYTSNDVSAFSVDAVSGALTAVKGSPFAVGRGARAIALD